MSKRVFFSYSQKDEALREELEAHLEVLRANGALTTWHARKIGPGEEWRAVAGREIDAADIVLLLVSADFLASSYCRDTEVQRAIERHTAGTARVVPVVLRPCLWDEAVFGHLAPLPEDGRPITRWPDRDEAWLDVARGVRGLVRDTAPREERHPSAPAAPVAEAPGAKAPGAEESRAQEQTALDRAAAKGAPRPEVEGWLRELEAAQVEKETLVSRGAEAAAIQAKIADLKRHLREGGQLQQNDSLGDGRYFLLRPLGRGGFATVWEADDRTTGKRVAIKVLHPQLASDPTRRERFFRGARAMAKITHPNVVRVLVPYEEDAGFFYFVMELLPGGDLHHAVLGGRFERARVVPLILAIGEALADAHAHGFVHRDVSPQNILLAADGTPRLSDFDLVAAVGTTGGTRTGAMGKFLYAAPEVMSRPQEANARADVFGLGMTAIFCLYGKDLPTHVLRRPEQILAELDCGPLAAILQKAIEWEPEQRYASAGAFCEALRAVASTLASGSVPAVPGTRRPPPGDLAARAPTPALEALLGPLPQHGQIALRRFLADAVRPEGWAAVGLVLVLLLLLVGGWTAAKSWLSGKTQDEPSGATTAPTASASGSVAGSATATSIAAPEVSSPCPPGMVFLPAGTFRMGSEATDKEAIPDERPPHDVTLSAFCLDRTEVTVATYRQCTQEDRNGVRCSPAPTTVQWTGADVKLWSRFCNADRSDRDEHPVNCVDWRTADTYCRWAGAALPTEAQWEYAARGKERRKYPWGDEKPGPTLLNVCGGECRALGKKHGQTWPVMYEGDDGDEVTAPVGRYSKGATPEGVLDLAGNVWEWVRDMSAAYSAVPAKDPLLTQGTLGVLRGGGFHCNDPREVRAAMRYSIGAGIRYDDVGFRCARGPNP